MNQSLGVVWREKSFGQRAKLGQPGGEFGSLGPRTIFLGLAKRRMHLSIIRMNHVFRLCHKSVQEGPHFLCVQPVLAFPKLHPTISDVCTAV